MNTVEHSISVLYDNIVRSQGVGACASCFSLDHASFCHLSQLHGLSVDDSVSLPEAHFKLVRHLLIGDCFRCADHNSGLPRGSRSHLVCSNLSFPFPSATNMSDAFLYRIVDDLEDDQKLSVQKISVLVSALCMDHYSPASFSIPSNVKRDASRLFKHFIIACPSNFATWMSLKTLRHVLHLLQVPFDASDSLNQLCQHLTLYRARIQKAPAGSDLSWSKLFSDLVHTRENWLQSVSSSTRGQVCENFLKLTGSSALKSRVCCSCGESCPISIIKDVKVCDIDLNLLWWPEIFEDDCLSSESWLDPSVLDPPFPFSDGILRDVLVNSHGVSGSGVETRLALCKHCLSLLLRGQVLHAVQVRY